MAKKQKETVVEQVQEQRQEPVYSRDELIAAAYSFGVKPEVMAGAIKLVGKDKMTRNEAERALKRFRKREV